MCDDDLMHYGILGMKWGVRRNRFKKIRTHENKYSDDYLDTQELQKRDAARLSNSELRRVNERLRLETEYSKLTKRHRSTGEKIVREILHDQAKVYGTKYIKRGIDCVIKL